MYTCCKFEKFGTLPALYPPSLTVLLSVVVVVATVEVVVGNGAAVVGGLNDK